MVNTQSISEARSSIENAIFNRFPMMYQLEDFCLECYNEPHVNKVANATIYIAIYKEIYPHIFGYITVGDIPRALTQFEAVETVASCVKNMTGRSALENAFHSYFRRSGYDTF